MPPRVFNPTHVNRRKGLFEEAIELARGGSSVDVTAFPVADDEDGWPAEVALVRYLDAGAPADRITISSDGGGCLPVFDAQGEMLSMDIGSPASLAQTFKALLDSGMPIETALPAFTSNVADLLRLNGRGRLVAGGAADLLVLDETHTINDVMASGAWHLRDGEVVVRGQFE